MHWHQVMPTHGGINDFAAHSKEKSWIPAFAGMTWAAISAGCFLLGAKRRSNLPPDELRNTRQAGDCFGASHLAMTGGSALQAPPCGAIPPPGQRFASA